MHHFDESNAECVVYTYREGVLAAVGHDLKLRPARFTIDVEPVTLAVRAEVDARTLRVVAAMVEGREKPGTPSPKDVVEIERNLAREVLDSARHPAVRFRSSAITPEGDRRYRVRGEVELRGQTRAVEFVVRREAGRAVAEFELNQPDFGIKPFSAMLGALKVRPAVRVVVSVPWAEA